MSSDRQESELDSNSESTQPEINDSLLPEQIEINVTDPALNEDFDDADFDHEFDDDFEEEISGEYDLEDDQYGEDFNKEFGHLTSDDDPKPSGDDK